MLTKADILNTINGLNEPIIIDDVLEKIYFLEKIERGIEQSNNNLILSEDEINERIDTWLV